MSTFRVWLPLLLLGLIGGVTSFRAPAGSYLWMQHVPTFLAVPLLAWLVRERRIDRGSLWCATGFLLLHCFGARWVYSNVPYDETLRTWFGSDTGDWFGWSRNHYDRLVHLSYGLLFTWPAYRLHRRFGGRSSWAAALLAVEFVLATSAAYELAEWAVAVIAAPDWADSYLGQQGDAWDAQKDVALATAGSCAVAIFVATFGASPGAMLNNHSCSKAERVLVPSEPA